MDTNIEKKKILISEANEQLRVARLDNKTLYDLVIEPKGKQNVDNIFNAEVVSIQPSLNAVFVNYGAKSKRNGFLPLKEIAPSYYPDALKNQIGNVSIKDLLFVGQKVLVQINKEERGNKGAAVSTYITLAGCYLVLMPNSEKTGGISRRIEGKEREALRDILSSLVIPEGMGVIVRTASIGKSHEEIQWDLDNLLNLWRAIQEASETHGAPHLIHQESDAAIRAVRDHFKPDVTEIFVDDQQIYERVHAYIERTQPQYLDRLKLYLDTQPLFSRFKVESQIESVFQRKVRLPSGGELVIDTTEALIAIDINSAKATQGEDIETTALATNLEAAKEIARQLRIRDLGGLIVIDFIDMEQDNHNRQVEQCLKEEMREDRARVQIGYISRFGLLELSRQRLRQFLGFASQITCPRCHGQGSIRSIPSLALSIIHILQETGLDENIRQVQVQTPISVATYLLNEKREAIETIENTRNVNISIVANPYIEIPDYHIEKSKGTHGGKAGRFSYELVVPPKLYYTPSSISSEQAKKITEPAVSKLLHTVPAPQKRTSRKKPSLLMQLKNKLAKWFTASEKSKDTKSHKSYDRSYRSHRAKQSGVSTSHRNKASVQGTQTKKRSSLINPRNTPTSHKTSRKSHSPYQKRSTRSNHTGPRRMQPNSTEYRKTAEVESIIPTQEKSTTSPSTFQSKPEPVITPIPKIKEPQKELKKAPEKLKQPAASILPVKSAPKEDWIQVETKSKNKE
jgi:ribonuclease E